MFIPLRHASRYADRSRQRCTDLLSRVTDDPLPTSLTSAVIPDDFENDELRQQFKMLRVGTEENLTVESHSKRRKVTNESRTLSKVTSALANVLGTEASLELRGVLESFG